MWRLITGQIKEKEEKGDLLLKFVDRCASSTYSDTAEPKKMLVHYQERVQAATVLTVRIQTDKSSE